MFLFQKFRISGEQTAVFPLGFQKCFNGTFFFNEGDHIVAVRIFGIDKFYFVDVHNSYSASSVPNYADHGEKSHSEMSIPPSQSIGMAVMKVP